MRFHWLIGAAVVALLTQASPSARATLMGATVQSASFFNVSFPPPSCTPLSCPMGSILDYQGPSGPTNSPLPVVPVTYLEDALTATTVSVGDTQITITNNLAGQIGTPGDFTGFVFTFTGAPDITNVVAGGSADFQPVAPPAGPPAGLTFTADSITVNVSGDTLRVGDQLILDVTTGVTPPPSVPEPRASHCWSAGLSACWRSIAARKAARTPAADDGERRSMSDFFIGTIRLVGFNFAPVDWALCQGQALSIADNPALYALIGTFFGGDGVQTFNLPDLRSRVALGQGQGPGLSNYLQGQAGGSETVTLTAGQAPAHSHTLMAATNVTTPNPGSGLALGTPATEVRLYGAASPTALAPNSIGAFGGSVAHENRQPFLALNYIIALQGIFPSQN